MGGSGPIWKKFTFRLFVVGSPYWITTRFVEHPMEKPVGLLITARDFSWKNFFNRINSQIWGFVFKISWFNFKKLAFQMVFIEHTWGPLYLLQNMKALCKKFRGLHCPESKVKFEIGNFYGIFHFHCRSICIPKAKSFSTPNFGLPVHSSSTKYSPHPPQGCFSLVVAMYVCKWVCLCVCPF